MIAVRILVPIFICVVLPVAIVWIVFRYINNKTNRQTEVILAAIQTNPNVDAEKLIETLRKKDRSPIEIINRKLLRGSIFTLIGVAFALIASLGDVDEVETGCWVVCGVCGAIGIGFLISYIFLITHKAVLNKENRADND